MKLAITRLTDEERENIYDALGHRTYAAWRGIVGSEFGEELRSSFSWLRRMLTDEKLSVGEACSRIRSDAYRYEDM
jgi:hypothetical protein